MTSALDAIARLDDGVALAGDRELADLFDQRASDYWHHRNLRLDAYTADRCVICRKPGEGSECDSCHNDAELAVVRSWDD